MIGPVFVSPYTTSHGSSWIVLVSLVFYCRCSHCAVAQLAQRGIGLEIVLLQVVSGALMACASCWRNCKHSPCEGHELCSHHFRILETRLSHLRLSPSRAHRHNDFARMESSHRTHLVKTGLSDMVVPVERRSAVWMRWHALRASTVVTPRSQHPLSWVFVQ